MNIQTDKKIRVCHLVSNLDVGGKENGIVNLCNNINRSRFEPIICCMKSTGVMAKRLNSDVKIENMGFAEGKSLLRPFRMAKYFKNEKMDIVHTHGWGGCSFDGIIGARLAGVPVVINGEHGASYDKLYQIYIQRNLARLCNITLSVSEGLKRRIVKEIAIKREKIKVIPNGVDTNYFNGEYDTETIKKEILKTNGIQFNKSTIFLGCIGSLKPSKNQKMIIEAFALINKNRKYNNIIILFVGDGPDRNMLEKYSIEKGIREKIVFLGQRNDMPVVLSLINILVLAAVCNREGMSNAILESMASRVPVISTRSIGSNELIIEGKNGFIIGNDDVKDLAEKIKIISESPELIKKMADNARSFICENNSLNHMVESYEDMYLTQYSKFTKMDSKLAFLHDNSI